MLERKRCTKYLLKELFKGTLEEMLESEMDEHLGYDKHSSEGIAVETVAMVTIRKPFKVNMEKYQLMYLEVEMENFLQR